MKLALVLMAAAGLAAGCGNNSAPPPAAAPAPATPPGAHVFPTQAQGKLPIARLWLGAEELQTELALTPIQEETGMMFRTNMPENTAMLFVFAQPLRASFWMKNTLIPLSCAYMTPDGAIAEIHDLAPQDTNAVVAATPNIEYVLEVNQGWFKRHHIEVGTVVRTEFGSMPASFTRRRAQ